MKKIYLLFLATLILSACSKNYKLEVQLTPERQAELMDLIQDSQFAIDNTQQDDISTIYFHMIDMAEAYYELGEAGKAIKIYEEMRAGKEKGQAALNNLGRLYEEVDEPEKAIEIYNQLIDEYKENKYLYDILWIYIDQGNLEKAREYYGRWKVAFERPDMKVEEALRVLKNTQN